MKVVDIENINCAIVKRNKSEITVLLPKEDKPAMSGGQMPEMSSSDIFQKLKKQRSIDAEYEDDGTSSEEEEQSSGGGGSQQDDKDTQLNIKNDKKQQQSGGGGGGGASNDEEDDEQDSEEDDSSDGSDSGDSEGSSGKSKGKDSKSSSKGGSEGDSEDSDTGDEGDTGDGEESDSDEVSGEAGEEMDSDDLIGDPISSSDGSSDSGDEGEDGEGSGSGSGSDEDNTDDEESDGSGSGSDSDSDDDEFDDLNGGSGSDDSDDEDSKDGKSGSGKSSKSKSDSADSEGEDGEGSESDDEDFGDLEDSDSDSDSDSSSSSSSSQSQSSGSSGDTDGNTSNTEGNAKDGLQTGSDIQEKPGIFDEIMKKIQDSKSDSQNVSDKSDEQRIEAENNKDDSSDTTSDGTPKDEIPPSWKMDDSEKSNLKDTLNTAMANGLKEKAEERAKNQNQSQSSTEDDDGGIDAQDSLLGQMGLQNLTSLYKVDTVRDWKKKLKKIVDIALGIKIESDPNIINKRIDDAPPGVEVENPDIKNVAILLDCSGSMGAEKFKDAIEHLTNMFMARKMNKTTFHIIPWGAPNMERVTRAYEKVVGARAVIPALMKHSRGDMGQTDVTVPFRLLMAKVKQIDLIIVLTDGEYNGFYGGVEDVMKYIRTKSKRIVWVFTRKHDENPTLKLDSMAKRMGRMVVMTGK